MNVDSLDFKLIFLVVIFILANIRLVWLVAKLRSWEFYVAGLVSALLLAGNLTSKNEFLHIPLTTQAAFTIIFIFFSFSPEILWMAAFLISRALPNKSATSRDTIAEILSGAELLSSTKTGALIAFELDDDLSKLAQSGTVVNSDVKKELMTALFSKEALTHDGGVIIKNGRIAHCSVIFPITFSLKIDKNLGTRHRAAIGLTESTDAICLIVSEEEGTISLARDGKIYYNLNRGTLEKYLKNWLFKKDLKVGYIFHRLRDTSLREQSQSALRFLPSLSSRIYNYVYLAFWSLLTLNLIFLNTGSLAKDSILSYLSPKLFLLDMWKWLPASQIILHTLHTLLKMECHFDQDSQIVSKERYLSLLPIWKTKRSFNELKRIVVRREGRRSQLWTLSIEDKEGKKILVDACGFPNGLLEDAKKIQNFLKIELINQS